MCKVTIWGTAILVAPLLASSVLAQRPPSALEQMVSTEQAFARRAGVIGWKQSFLEYFADDAIGFADDHTEPAKDQLRQVPDPPKDLQLLWEPRWGDIAASGELGFLTGPSTTINPARNNGAPRHGNYASVWKRQPDGSFKVLIDVGISTPEAVPFAPGFTRAPAGDRYRGTDTVEAATRALAEADRLLTRGALGNQAVAYGPVLAEGIRLHRPGTMPVAGRAEAERWLQTQPAYSAGTSLKAEVAASRDLGYTWGTYTLPAAGATSQKGMYLRVWVRTAAGRWQVALDVLQPQ